MSLKQPVRHVVVVVGALAALMGCIEMDIPPAGSYSEVLLVTEDGIQDPLARQLAPQLEKRLDFVTRQEAQFKVRHVRAANLDEMPQVKNIVICGVPDPLTDVGRRIISLLGESALQKVQLSEASIFKKDDLPGAGQLTIIVTGPTKGAIGTVLEERGSDIRRTLERSCRQRLRRSLLKNSNPVLTQRLHRQYGFKLQIPTLYDLLSEDSNPPGIELLRDGPSRLLGVFWLDWETQPTLENGQELFDARAAYVWERYDGDTMDSTRVSYSVTTLGEYPAIRMEGYWSSSTTIAGGYYQSYFIYRERERLLWVVDLLVYAPGLPKQPLFRELLAVAETFKLD